MYDLKKTAYYYRIKMSFLHLGYQILFFGLPLLILAYNSFRSFSLGSPTGIYTLDNFRYLLTDGVFIPALITSFILSVIVSLSSTILGIIFTLSFWEMRTSYKSLIFHSIFIVFIVGITPRLHALAFLLSSGNFLGSIFNQQIDTTFLYARQGVYLGYISIYVPLSIIISCFARNSIPGSLVLVAEDLGCSWIDVQKMIVFPLMLPALTVSFVLIFLLCLGDINVIFAVGGGSVYSASNFVIDAIKVNDWGLASSASLIILIFSLIILFIFSHILPKLIFGFIYE